MHPMHFKGCAVHDLRAAACTAVSHMVHIRLWNLGEMKGKMITRFMNEVAYIDAVALEPLAMSA